MAAEASDYNRLYRDASQGSDPDASARSTRSDQQTMAQRLLNRLPADGSGRSQAALASVPDAPPFDPWVRHSESNVTAADAAAGAPRRTCYACDGLLDSPPSTFCGFCGVKEPDKPPPGAPPAESDGSEPPQFMRVHVDEMWAVKRELSDREAEVKELSRILMSVKAARMDELLREKDEEVSSLMDQLEKAKQQSAARELKLQSNLRLITE